MGDKKVLIIGLLIAIIFFLVFYFIKCDISYALDNTLKVFQILALIGGGWRAYFKFGWEKRAENAIQLKALLMDYNNKFESAALQYRTEEKDNEPNARMKFAMTMIPLYNHILNQTKLSLYLHKSLRTEILNVLWLSLGENNRPKGEALSNNWIQFHTKINSIFDKLEDYMKTIDL